MKKIWLVSFVFLLFVLLFSCKSTSASWDNSIADEKKAAFLFSQLNDQYQDALDIGDVSKLQQISQDLKFVSNMDNSKAGDVQNLIDRINTNIVEIKKNKLKKANDFAAKKDYVNAALEYNIILGYEPKNKVAADFFKKNNQFLEEAVMKNKADIKQSIDKGNFTKAEKDIVRLKRVVPKDKDIVALTSDLKKAKDKQRDEYIVTAKKLLTEKKYEKSSSSANLALQLDPNSLEAQRIIAETNKYLKKPVVKKSDTAKETDTYYNNANDAFNNKQYTIAVREINKYLSILDDQKGKDLEAKIKTEIKTQVDTIMGDAVLNYNSQKYEDALKLFKNILAIDPNNDEASDYKSRIEKRLQSFE